jgi:Protein of unknown function (DUF1579)
MTACVCSRLALRTLVKLPRCVKGLTARSFPRVSLSHDNHDYILKRIIMQRISVLLFLLVVCLTTAMRAQAPAPKPGPEVKKLRAMLGHWTYEGEAKPGPGCLGGKFTGEMTCQMSLGGFFLQCRFTEKDSAVLETDAYDPVNKNFTHDSYSDDGGRFSGVVPAKNSIPVENVVLATRRCSRQRACVLCLYHCWLA